MAGIRVVTDSVGDIPASLVAEHDIRIVPLDVRLGDWGPDEMRLIEPWVLASLCHDRGFARNFCAITGSIRRELHTGGR